MNQLLQHHLQVLLNHSNISTQLCLHHLSAGTMIDHGSGTMIDHGSGTMMELGSGSMLIHDGGDESMEKLRKISLGKTKREEESSTDENPLAHRSFSKSVLDGFGSTSSGT